MILIIYLLNRIIMKKSLLFVFLLSFVAFTGVNGQNLVVNPSLENWDDANTPTGWDKAENITQESTIVHSGTYSAKHNADGTKDLSQTFSVTAGTSYKISVWYYIESGDGTDARIWSYWRDGSGTIDDNADELRGPNNSYFPDEKGEWKNYEVVLVAPAAAIEFYFEVRSYGDAVVYWDDFSVEEYIPSVEAPVFSPAGGVVMEPQTIAITSATEGASIYYTLDGTTPTDASTFYTAPFEISTTTTINAIAYSGSDASSVTTATYTFPVDCATIAEFLLLEDGTLASITGEVVSVDVNESYGTVTSMVIKDANNDELTVYGVFRISDIIYEVGQTLNLVGERDSYNGADQMSFSSNSGHSIVIDSPSGIVKGTKATVKVVPNPFTTEFRIDGDAVSVSLYNAAGQLVKNIPAVAGVVSTSDLSKGMYILQVKLADGTVSTQKVIKK